MCVPGEVPRPPKGNREAGVASQDEGARQTVQAFAGTAESWTEGTDSYIQWWPLSWSE